MKQYTTEQIRIYLMSKETLGDAIFSLSPEAIEHAVTHQTEEEEEFMDS